MIIHDIKYNNVKYKIDVTPKGGWTENAIAIILRKHIGSKYLFERDGYLIFYQPNPDFEKGHSHYFGYRYSSISGIFSIFNAEKIVNNSIISVIRKGKYWIYSHSVHDYVDGSNGSIDGGFDYVRLIGNPFPEMIQFKIVNGNFEKVVDKSS